MPQCHKRARPGGLPSTQPHVPSSKRLQWPGPGRRHPTAVTSETVLRNKAPLDGPATQGCGGTGVALLSTVLLYCWCGWRDTQATMKSEPRDPWMGGHRAGHSQDSTGTPSHPGPVADGCPGATSCAHPTPYVCSVSSSHPESPQVLEDCTAGRGQATSPQGLCWL